MKSFGFAFFKENVLIPCSSLGNEWLVPLIQTFDLLAYWQSAQYQHYYEVMGVPSEAETNRWLTVWNAMEKHS